MLADIAIENLRDALDGLSAPAVAGVWGAIEPLGRLHESGLDVVIDFRATSALKMPVIVVSPTPPAEALLSRLSPRRRAVAELMVQGASNKDIARSLNLSLGTVKDHVHDILRILGLPSRAAVMAAALHRQ